MNKKAKVILFNLLIVFVLLLSSEFFIWGYINYKYKKEINFNPHAKIIKFHPGVKYFPQIYKKECFQDYEWSGRFPEGLYYKKKPIVVFGCSFAYGFLLKNEETFSYKLSHLSKRPVYNRAYPGWGIQHMLYQVRDKEFYKIIPEPEYVIYIYQLDHLRRLYVKRFNDFALLSEYLYLTYIEENNKNLVEEYKYKKNHHLNIIKRSYLYNKIYEILLSKLFYSIVNNHDENNFLIKNITNSKKLDNINTNFAFLHFISAKEEMQKHWKNTKYIIFSYDDYYFHEEFLKRLSDNGFIVLKANDLTNENLLSSEFIQKDGIHPIGKVWDILTPKIIEKIN